MQYQAPLGDIKFVLFDVLGGNQLHELEKYSEATPDLISAILEEAGKLTAEVLQPCNKAGDQQGCQYDPETHSVTTPDGFKEAYRQFTEAGWASLDAPVEFGGQGLPMSLAVPGLAVYWRAAAPDADASQLEVMDRAGAVHADVSH